MGVKEWKSAVLAYKYIPYDTIWDAFRALDHQIDSESREIGWLSECLRVLDELLGLGDEDASRITQDIDALLSKLKHIKVEEKKLARITLIYSKNILGLRRFKQVKGLLGLAQDLFRLRIAESRQIISGLFQARLKTFRQEVESRNNYLKQKTIKILRDLKSNRYRLTRIILKEDLLDTRHEVYFKEPEFNPIFAALNKIGKMLERSSLTNNELLEVKELFMLLRDKTSASVKLNSYMPSYSDRFVSSELEGEPDRISRYDAFLETFKEYFTLDKAVKNAPDLYWAIFYQAAFISAHQKEDRNQDNPLFLAVSEEITQRQIERAKYDNLGGLLPRKEFQLSSEERAEFEKAFHCPVSSSSAIIHKRQEVTTAINQLMELLTQGITGKTLRESLQRHRPMEYLDEPEETYSELLNYFESREPGRLGVLYADRLKEEIYKLIFEGRDRYFSQALSLILDMLKKVRLTDNYMNISTKIVGAFKAEPGCFGRTFEHVFKDILRTTCIVLNKALTDNNLKTKKVIDVADMNLPINHSVANAITKTHKTQHAKIKVVLEHGSIRLTLGKKYTEVNKF